MQCECTGIRFCAQCHDSERVQSALSGAIALRDAKDVIANQDRDARTSSCSFAMLPPSRYAMCIDCACIFSSPSAIRSCLGHVNESVLNDLFIPGLFITRDCVTAGMEEELVRFLDSTGGQFPPWQSSQSGRRKHEFGPQKNFKKMKVNCSRFTAMPAVFKEVMTIVSNLTEKLTNSRYTVAEASALEYTADNMSNFDPHIDDTWLWGRRIVGINLLEDCAITFVDKSGTPIDVFLPRYCFFMMSGDCRYNWMHGIRPENVKLRRISITFRELATSIMNTHPEECAQMLQAASTFL